MTPPEDDAATSEVQARLFGMADPLTATEPFSRSLFVVVLLLGVIFLGGLLLFCDPQMVRAYELETSSHHALEASTPHVQQRHSDRMR